MTANPEDKDWQTIERWMEDPTFVHWAKKINHDDIRRWENYLNLHPHQWELAKVARSLILGISFEPIPPMSDQRENALSSLMKRMKALDDNNRVQARNQRNTKRLGLIMAASLAICLISGIIYWQFFFNPQIILATEYGEQLETELPDGSLVTLNANSKLSYAKLNCREVRLEGEAYFEIEKKPETGAKFKVLTKDLSVTVLGTSFNVNTRDDQTKVFLQTGKITLAVADAKSGEIEMEPGDFISYSRKNQQLEKKLDDTSALETASWKEGALIFNDTPLMEALFKIEDIYGIQFIIQTDDIKMEKISGGVPIKDLQVTLSTLSEVYGLQMEAIGKRYFISGMN